MLQTFFETYKQYSTRKTATGMSEHTVKSLLTYVKKYEAFTHEYNYHTFKTFLTLIQLSHNSKAFLAHSMGRFLWMSELVSKDEFDKLKALYRHQLPVWSDKRVTNSDIDTIIWAVEIASKNDFIKNRNLLFFGLLALTSLRISQISLINRQGLIFDDNSIKISIDEKKLNSNDLQAKKRYLKLPLQSKFAKYDLKTLFNNYLSYFPNSETLFVTEKGMPISVRGLQKIIEGISKQYGLNISAHTFRHEAVSRATKKYGLHIGAILAGHKSIQTTMRYVNPEVMDLDNVFLTYNEE